MKKQTRADWKTRVAVASIAAILFSLAASYQTLAQGAGYRVGEPIEILYVAKWYKGKILEIKDGSYKVRYDDYGSSWDEWVKPDRVRRAGQGDAAGGTRTAQPTATTPNNPRPPAQTNTPTNTPAGPMTPKMAGAFPSLNGTGWKIDFGKGVTGTIFLFCKNGRWEIVPERRGTIGAVGRSYKVAGSTLTTVNADDGMVQKWKMTWKGGVLELFDGKTRLRLHYNGISLC